MVKKNLFGLQEPWWSGKSDRPKTVDSKAVLQAIEVNLVSLASLSPRWFVTFTTLAKVFRATELCTMLPKYCKYCIYSL